MARTMKGDHPRSRGVYACVSTHWPPPAWIIPARAGFTSGRQSSSTTGRDHPRSRGVYSTEVTADTQPAGSSPLARGLLGVAELDRQAARIIPARAGFTPSSPPCPRSEPDHPRSRGVYEEEAHRLRLLVGSSPLARGLRVCGHVHAPLVRIIPARAGFTCRGSPRAGRHRDHPRSRGVYEGHKWEFPYGHGSSPLARGLLRGADDVRPDRRIIPARAGFTASCGATSGRRRDHPRSRGVYTTEAGRKNQSAGSSPLARGLHDHLGGRLPVGGIIPARAGFTATRRSRAIRVWDHPRSRGVYRRVRQVMPRFVGSSPLARGLLSIEWLASLRRGIIPARAGFTI